MKKEETLYTTKGVYLTGSIYKTKIPYMGYFSYITHPLVTTLTKQETLPNRLFDAFKRILQTTRYHTPLLTQLHRNTTPKTNPTRYNTKNGSTKKHRDYIKTPRKQLPNHAITQKSQNGWGTTYFYKKYASRNEMVSPSMPPTIGI